MKEVRLSFYTRLTEGEKDQLKVQVGQHCMYLTNIRFEKQEQYDDSDDKSRSDSSHGIY